MSVFPFICTMCLLMFLTLGVTGTPTNAQNDFFSIIGIGPRCLEASVSNVAASGETTTVEPGGPADYAVDGNLSTYWVDRGVGSYLELEFEEPQTLCYAEIAWPYGDTRTWYFDISSVNGTNDVLLFSGSSSGNTTGPEKYDLPDSVSEKIKITVNGNSKSNYSGISEIKVYAIPPI